MNIWDDVVHDFQRGEHTIAAWLHHRTYHPNQHNTPGEPAMQALIATIENDLATAGHAVDQAVHDVLAKHLHLVNVLDQAVRETQAIQATAPAQFAERWGGANPDLVTRALAIADEALHQLTTMGQAPAADPAQPQG